MIHLSILRTNNAVSGIRRCISSSSTMMQAIKRVDPPRKKVSENRPDIAAQTTQAAQKREVVPGWTN
jgi:hypothetical protein